MSDNLRVVDNFLTAYFLQDCARVLELTTEDFIWRNMALPKADLEGHAALARKLVMPNLGLPIPLEEACHEILEHLEQHELVMHERVDRLRFKGQWLEVPCAALFRVRGGRVALWKDYYDIGVVLRFMRGIGVDLDTSGWW